MTPVEVLEALMALAEQAGLSVRVLGRRGGADAPPLAASGICRVRGVVWVVLAPDDPAAAQIELLASALRTHAREYLGDHYVAPAIREYLGEKSGG